MQQTKETWEQLLRRTYKENAEYHIHQHILWYGRASLRELV